MRATRDHPPGRPAPSPPAPPKREQVHVTTCELVETANGGPGYRVSCSCGWVSQEPTSYGPKDLLYTQEAGAERIALAHRNQHAAAEDAHDARLALILKAIKEPQAFCERAMNWLPPQFRAVESMESWQARAVCIALDRGSG